MIKRLYAMKGRLSGIVVILLFTSITHPATLDEQLYTATRYGNTPERREAKQKAREELKTHMPDAMQTAMKYIHGDNVGLQVLVMEWVLELPSETIVPVLLDWIDHERSETRRVALFFLGFHDTPEHAARVRPYLKDEDCSGAALRTLGKWKDPEARSYAEDLLVNGPERLRVVAANALRDLGDPATIPALIAALVDPVFTVRNTAARALISFGEQAVAALQANEIKSEMIQRCLIDLKESVPKSADRESVVVDGDFFLP